MSQTTLEKLNTDVSYLQKEIDVLRSFVIGVIAKDKEGGYKPEFFFLNLRKYDSGCL